MDKSKCPMPRYVKRCKRLRYGVFVHAFDILTLVLRSILLQIVVVDPSDGFATGGGHIDSPPGAYPDNTTLSGHGQYCFIIKYKPGKSEPSGKASFKFNGMDLSSTSYDWLVVTDDFCAMFEGDAEVNGNPGYSFMITACDYGSKMGSFMIKIWDTITDVVMYDNHFDGTMIAGGDIRVEL